MCVKNVIHVLVDEHVHFLRRGDVPSGAVCRCRILFCKCFQVLDRNDQVICLAVCRAIIVIRQQHFRILVTENPVEIYIIIINLNGRIVGLVYRIEIRSALKTSHRVTDFLPRKIARSNLFYRYGQPVCSALSLSALRKDSFPWAAAGRL